MKYIGVFEEIDVSNDGVRRFIVDSTSFDYLSEVNKNSITDEAPRYLLLTFEVKKDDRFEYSGWLNFDISDKKTESSIEVTTVTMGLDSDSESQEIKLYISNISKASDNERSYFNIFWKEFTPKNYPISHDDFENYLSLFSPDSVAVYDVGQAQFTALIGANQYPVAYIDVGWPLGFNSKSLPRLKNFNPFFRNENDSPVILTHLDWDHWGYCVKSGKPKFDDQTLTWITEPVYKKEVILRPWIIRSPDYVRHNLGPSHANLLFNLSKGKDSKNINYLKLISPGVKISTSQFLLCSNSDIPQKHTPSYLRNNESIVFCLFDRYSSGYRCFENTILILGDAEYGSFKYLNRYKYRYIVAPHHGGKIDDGNIPIYEYDYYRDKKPNLIISSGDCCYNNMPNSKMILKANINNWRCSSTFIRNECPHCSEIKGHFSLHPKDRETYPSNEIINNQICLNN